MKRYKLILLVALLYIAGSCRKESPELYDQNNNINLSDAPSEVFLSFWHGMNNAYSFWDVDPTDWDQVYDEYLPRFQALDSQKIVSTEELEELYTKLSENLIDHHFNAKIKNYRIEGGANTFDEFVIAPSDNEIMKRSYYHPKDENFKSNLDKVFEKYTQEDRITSFKHGEYDDKFAYSFDIDNGVAYLYLNEFAISTIINVASTDAEDYKKTIGNFLEMVIEKPNLKGVIIDVRNNGGGRMSDLSLLIGTMIDEVTTFGYTRSKNGLGRYDYEGWVKSAISPTQIHRKMEGPIVVIANLHSVSMSEITSMTVQNLPNGYLVGERTYGGTGTLTGNYNHTYAGKFENNMVSVYAATLMVKNVDGLILEGIGVTPDIEVLDDPQSMSQGVDKQIDAALKVIKENSSIK